MIQRPPTFSIFPLELNTFKENCYLLLFRKNSANVITDKIKYGMYSFEKYGK